MSIKDGVSFLKKKTMTKKDAAMNGLNPPAIPMTRTMWENLDCIQEDGKAMTVAEMNSLMTSRGKANMKEFLVDKTELDIQLYVMRMTSLVETFQCRENTLKKQLKPSLRTELYKELSLERGAFASMKEQATASKKQVVEAYKRLQKGPGKSRETHKVDNSDSVLGVLSLCVGNGSVGGYGAGGGGVGGADQGHIQPPPPPLNDKVPKTGYKRVYDESPEEKQHIESLSKKEKLHYWNEAVEQEKTMKNKDDCINKFQSAVQLAFSVLSFANTAVLGSNGLVKQAEEKVKDAKCSLAQAEAELEKVSSLAVPIHADAQRAKDDYAFKIAQLKEAKM